MTFRIWLGRLRKVQVPMRGPNFIKQLELRLEPSRSMDGTLKLEIGHLGTTSTVHSIYPERVSHGCRTLGAWSDSEPPAITTMVKHEHFYQNLGIPNLRVSPNCPRQYWPTGAKSRELEGPGPGLILVHAPHNYGGIELALIRPRIRWWPGAIHSGKFLQSVGVFCLLTAFIQPWKTGTSSRLGLQVQVVALLRDGAREKYTSSISSAFPSQVRCSKVIYLSIFRMRSHSVHWSR
jgi:hypothetical protein